MGIPCKLVLGRILVCEIPQRKGSDTQEPSMITGSKMIRNMVTTVVSFGPELTQSQQSRENIF